MHKVILMETEPHDQKHPTKSNALFGIRHDFILFPKVSK